MLLERRRPPEAKAWRNPQDRLPSGRYAARESHASEARCQNPGRVPDGGLARPRVAESAAPGLPPLKAEVPSRATGRWQHRPPAAEVAREGRVGSTVRGASYSPGQPGKHTAGIDGAKPLPPPQRWRLANTRHLAGTATARRRLWIPKRGWKRNKLLC